MVNPLIMIGILGTGFLIASVVHQDAIPGVRQDWLVRPVKRRDLLPGGRARIEANNLEIRNEGHGESEKRIHQWIHFSSELYAQMNDQPVRLEIDYSLTLFSLAASHALPALNGDQRMAHVGWCATKLNNDGRTQVTLRCLQAQYPVDGSQLAESQVVLRTYQPLDHFTRRLVIPEIRLKDWASGLGF
jgi:hypothetical protein